MCLRSALSHYAKIAGIMHDIGNVISRIDHAQSGAVMAFRILDNLDVDFSMDPKDVEYLDSLHHIGPTREMRS